jgi:osmoprotectant transport system ATP-binding protein
VIALKGVSKRFGDTAAVDTLDLTCAAHRTTALIGPSGSGKSTILRLIAGLATPTTGTVEVGGTPVTAESLPGLRRRMGYVIQEGGLFPHLTAEGNVTLMARHLRQPPTATARRLRDLCDLTHFPADGLTRYPAELSGGQRQRVSLMRALMLDPDVLLLDEPLGSLDPLVRASLQTELREIVTRLERTVVLVTHDLPEAAYLAHHIVLLHSGRIVQQGTLEDLRDRPADGFVGEFLSAQRRVF